MAKPWPIFLLRHIQMPSSKVQTPSKRGESKCHKSFYVNEDNEITIFST